MTSRIPAAGAISPPLSPSWSSPRWVTGLSITSTISARSRTASISGAMTASIGSSEGSSSRRLTCSLRRGISPALQRRVSAAFIFSARRLAASAVAAKLAFVRLRPGYARFFSPATGIRRPTREADLSTQQARAQASPWLPRALRDGRRPQSARCAPGARSQEAFRLIGSLQLRSLSGRSRVDEDAAEGALTPCMRTASRAPPANLLAA